MGEFVISGSTHVADIKDLIELKGECGSGKFATVQKSRLKSSGLEVAVKIINKAKTYEHTKNGQHKNDPFYRVEREITILSSLSHPHIVEFKGCYEDSENVYIVQDYVTYDNCKFDLDDYLLYHGNLSELHSHHLFCQLLSAIEYIHYKNICHCDLKTANILISNIGIKLIDFGLSRYFQKDLLFHKVYGTPNYMSPEIYLNTPEPGYDGVKADIWACGIILYIMITREKPFIGEDIMELRNNIINHEYVPIKTVSDDLNDLLSKIFIKDPNKRISLSQIKHHKWITSNIPESEDGNKNNSKKENNKSNNNCCGYDVLPVSTPTSVKKNNNNNNNKRNDIENKEKNNNNDLKENSEIKNDDKNNGINSATENTNDHYIDNYIENNINHNEDDDDLPLNRSSSITLAMAKSTKPKRSNIYHNNSNSNRFNQPIIPPLYPNNPLFQSEPDISNDNLNNNNNSKTNLPFNGNAISIYEFITEQNGEEDDDDEDVVNNNDKKNDDIEDNSNIKHRRHYSFQSFPISSSSLSSLHSTKTTPSFKPRSLSSAFSNTSPFLSSFSLLPPPTLSSSTTNVTNTLLNRNSSGSNSSLALPLGINSSTNSINNNSVGLTSNPANSNSMNNNSNNNSTTTPTGQYSIFPNQSPFLQPIPVLPHTYSLSLDDEFGEEEEECDLDAIWQFRG